MVNSLGGDCRTSQEVRELKFYFWAVEISRRRRTSQEVRELK